MTKTNETYYIKARNSGEGWIKTNAKTVRGAKNVASKTYMESVGSALMVGIATGTDWQDSDIVEVAIKSAY